MVLLGDVLAVVAALLGICLSAWAMTVACGLLFPERAEASRERLQNRPWQAMGFGLLLTFTVGLFSLILLGLPIPLAKLFGGMLALGLLSVASVGMAGLALLAGQRMWQMAPTLSLFSAFVRGAGLLVAASVLPLLGWYVFAPLLFMASLGAGFLALTSRAPRESLA